MKKLFITAALALGLSVSFTPGSKAQGFVDSVVSVEVLDGGAMPDGQTRAALHFKLADGWKTYWRAPGDAGIPPQFSWRGSRNLADARVIWPTPKVFEQNGMRSVGYAGELVLPLVLTPKTPGKPLRLKGRIDIGICEDVCVPATLKVDHAPDPAAPRHPAIAAALAQRPYSASEAGVSAAVCHIRPTDHGLQLEAHLALPSAGGPEFAVIEPGNPQIWASEAQVTRRGGTLIAISDLMHVDSGSFALDRSQIRITILGKHHAVDIRGCTPG